MNCFEVNNSKYINDDCISVMTEMIKENQKVNCILVDPPYGINHHSNRRVDKSDTLTKKGILNDNDNIDLLLEAIELSYNCLENNSHIYWFTRWDKIDEQLPLLKCYYDIKNIIIWDKGNHGSGDLTGAYGNRYECIIYGMKGRRTLNIVGGKQRHDDIISFSKIPASRLIHPHQKPIELLEFLVLKSTNEGDVILDMFGGVGSVFCASEKNNRSCITVELDTELYDKGIEYIQSILQ